jgi:hypothetical protein
VSDPEASAVHQEPAATAASGWPWSWFEANSTLLGAAFVLSIASLVLVLLLLPVIVVRLDADHFAPDRVLRPQRRGAVWFVFHLGKNLLGVVFVLVGVALLLLPGQGLLTILIGLLMLDFPGKQTLERRIVARPAILAFLNRMRVRAGRPPLRVDAR